MTDAPVPEALGCLAPKKLNLKETPENVVKRVRAIYAAAGAGDKLVVE